MHPVTVVRQDVELVDVVVGLPRHDCVHAAGVVADHSADRAVAVRGRVGTEREAVFLGRVAEVVEHDPGLDARELPGRVHLQDLVHVLREIEDDGDVAALAGEARAGAAGEDRRAELARQLDRRVDVVDGPREDHADRHLAVVRGVGGVERARAVVEADLAANVVPQRGRQRRRVDVQ